MTNGQHFVASNFGAIWGIAIATIVLKKFPQNPLLRFLFGALISVILASLEAAIQWWLR